MDDYLDYKNRENRVANKMQHLRFVIDKLKIVDKKTAWKAYMNEPGSGAKEVLYQIYCNFRDDLPDNYIRASKYGH